MLLLLVSGRVDLILCLVQRARYPNQFLLQKVPVQRWKHSIISSKKQTGFNTQVVDLKLSELQKVLCDDHPNWFYDDTLSPPKQKLKDQAILREIMSFFWVPVKCPGSHPQMNGLNSWTSNKLRSPPPALVGGWFPPTHPKKIWTSNLIILGPGWKFQKYEWVATTLAPGGMKNFLFVSIFKVNQRSLSLGTRFQLLKCRWCANSRCATTLIGGTDALLRQQAFLAFRILRATDGLTKSNQLQGHFFSQVTWHESLKLLSCLFRISCIWPT